MYPCVDKFGHSSIRSDRNALKNAGIQLDKERLINLGYPIDDNDGISLKYLNEGMNRSINKLERQIQDLRVALTDNIKNDVMFIEAVIEDKINITYKQSYQELSDYLQSIENFLLNHVVTNKPASEDDVKKLKIKHPVIKA